MVETIAFEPILGKTDDLRVSGIKPTTGEIILTDDRMSRIVYLDVEKRTCRREHFKRSHPNTYESSRVCLKLRYNYVENLLSFTGNRNADPNPDDNFLNEGS